jgi:hypothetical protein
MGLKAAKVIHIKLYAADDGFSGNLSSAVLRMYGRYLTTAKIARFIAIKL